MGLVVSKNEELCIKTEELCIKTEELCITNEELCIQNDELCSSAAYDGSGKMFRCVVGLRGEDGPRVGAFLYKNEDSSMEMKMIPLKQ